MGWQCIHVVVPDVTQTKDSGCDKNGPCESSNKGKPENNILLLGVKGDADQQQKRKRKETSITYTQNAFEQ